MASLPAQVVAATFGAALLATSVQAQTASPAETTTVRDVSVVGGHKPLLTDEQIPPTAEQPKSATCEFLIAADPYLRALVMAGQGVELNALINALPGPDSGPPQVISTLMAPRIYQPTRPPRMVSFAAAAAAAGSESGSVEIPRRFRGISTRPSKGDGDRMVASSLCRATSQPGGIAPGESAVQQDALNRGRIEIAYDDEFLPTGLALFEQGRYADSLVYFHRAFDKLSYEHGGDEASLMIGKLLLGAPGVERDTAQAVSWLKKTAGARFDASTQMPVFDPREPERNTAIGEAAMILARLYQTGAAGVGKDSVEARKWFERAFEVGHVPAAAILGDIHYFGAGVAEDPKKAFDYYRQGARLGHAPAQNALADMYASGEAPEGRDLALALAWRNAAARLGNPRALHDLALAYETGEGVAADPERALALYKLAALAGSGPAKNAVGTFFYEGRTLARDPALARRWFEQGAIAGDPDAMFNLGAMMMKGEGGEADRTRAWVWLKMAEKGENPNAGAAVGVLEARMTAEEKSAAAKLFAPTNS